MKNKKIKIAIIGVIALVLVTVGITYAYWLITRTQTKTNVIGAGCLDISLSDEQNDIYLSKQYPIPDETGMNLTPFTFTITNNCNTSVDYQLNLETLGDSTTALSPSSIKVAINDNASLLSNKEKRDTTIEGAYASYQLLYGRLEAKGTEGSSDTHNLRIWMDIKAPNSEMNKSFTSKISVTAGQGIENPYNEGTMAFNIVGNAGGLGYITELDAQEDGMPEAERSWRVNSVSENYFWGTDYELDSKNGYILSGDIVEASVEECRAGTKQCGNYTFLKTSKDVYSDTLLIVNSFEHESGSNYITVQLQSIVATEFVLPSSEDESGLHMAQDDMGTSYYYRGAPINNYVKFGTWAENVTEIKGYYSSTSSNFQLYDSLEACNSATSYNYNCAEETLANIGDDMYWRIVRINGDGTIRMIYDGTEAVANGEIHKANISSSPFSSTGSGLFYVSKASDGTIVDTIVKSTIDKWYDTNLETNYGTYIADNIFCQDSKYSFDSRYFAAYDRAYRNKLPVLTCTLSSNKYTVSTEYGNGYLSNPVGLITVDEARMSGATLNATNTNHYLFSGETYSTLSIVNSAASTVVNSEGQIFRDNSPTQFRSVRPVINLRTDVAFTGEGTIDSPYIIITE